MADCFDEDMLVFCNGARSEQMPFLRSLANSCNSAHRKHMQTAGSLNRNGWRFDPAYLASPGSGWPLSLHCSGAEGCPEKSCVTIHHKTLAVPVPAHTASHERCYVGDDKFQGLVALLGCSTNLTERGGTVHCELGEDCLS